MTGDPRLTPARPEIAAAHLRGTVEAARFAEPVACRIRRGRVALRAAPDPATPFATVLLYGEPFDVYERANGWAWGQSGLDGYVGFLPVAGLMHANRAAPTHRVRTLGAQHYTGPVLKSAPAGTLPFGARVTVTGRRDGFARLDTGLWMPEAQLAPVDEPEPDWVATAERFIGVPYVWGGRSSMGIDCSALVQLALQASCIECPRDSDMQEGALQRTLRRNAALRRGDLIYWPGHCGIMTDGAMLLHANARHMAVTTEPLAAVVQRIEASGDGAITRRVRLDGTRRVD